MNNPTTPYTLSNEFYILGYREPFKWIIDNDNRCWIEDMELNSFEEFSQTDLIEHPCISFKDRDEIRKFFKIKRILPQWCKDALKSGWIPPANFNIEDYE